MARIGANASQRLALTVSGDGMTDESVTVATALYIVKLADRVRRIADPADARELASRVADAMERPDRPVADAFRIEPSRDRRDRIVRDLAGEGSLRKQASAIRQKARRYRAQPGDRATAGERGLLWQLEQIGSLDLSERQIRRILGGR
jgi:hypothetical protein